MIDINEITDRQIWDDFVIKNTSDTFLQSWSWGEFNKASENKIWRLGLYYQDNLILVLLVIKIKAKRGSFLFVPHGPIIDSLELTPAADAGAPEKGFRDEKKISEFLETTLHELIKIAIGENCSFIRIAPILKNTPTNNALFKDLGLKEAPIHIHSELSWVLDITRPEDELLSNMRKTTRYLIRQKDKLGVTIETTQNIRDLDRFYDLYKKTEKRQSFTAYSFDYLKREFDIFARQGNVSLYFASYKKDDLASAFIIKYGTAGFNHHAGSSYDYPKIPGSYILHWEIIKDLKKQGFSFYNFWGIAPEGKPNHPWQGITLFKKGFGGTSKEYLHTKDYPLKLTYWLNWAVETARRIKRRY